MKLNRDAQLPFTLLYQLSRNVYRLLNYYYQSTFYLVKLRNIFSINN